MKYEDEILIHAPLKVVTDLFTDTDKLKLWQPGLISHEHLSGTPGQKGARTSLIHKVGKREIHMIETITIHNLPEELTMTYETKGVFNIVRNKFSSPDENTCIYQVENEFHFSGIYKLFALLMPGSFRKETRKSLERFRDFVEQGSDH